MSRNSNHINPLVSVCIFTYNQEAYIQQCLQGVLDQLIDFPIEILIGEDASTDGTLAICKVFAERNPDRVRLIAHNSNIGMQANWQYCLLEAKGKYIALCEGDDYWTFNGKLQQQVNFLEANDDFGLSFHDAQIINERDPANTIERYSGYDWNHIDPAREVYDLADLLHATMCPTASVVFRKPSSFALPGWYGSLPFVDMSLFILVTGNQKIKYFNKCWSVYRRHSGSASAVPESGARFTTGKIDMYLHLYNDLPADKRKQVPAIISKLYNSLPPGSLLPEKSMLKIKAMMPALYWKLAARLYRSVVKNNINQLKQKFNR